MRTSSPTRVDGGDELRRACRGSRASSPDVDRGDAERERRDRPTSAKPAPRACGRRAARSDGKLRDAIAAGSGTRSGARTPARRRAAARGGSTARRSDRTSADRGVENSSTTNRAPGASTRRTSRKRGVEVGRRCECRTRRSRRRTTRRASGSASASATTGASTARRRLAAPGAQHRLGEVGADDEPAKSGRRARSRRPRRACRRTDRGTSRAGRRSTPSARDRRAPPATGRCRTLSRWLSRS